MASASVEELVDRFTGELAPFLRHEELYGSILLPSLIINKKGCHRAVVNRHATFLFKSWALSSPETAISLRRRALEILPGLTDAFLSGAQMPGTPRGRLLESLFRFNVWAGRDSRAIELVTAAGQGAGPFLRRCAVLLCTGAAEQRPGWLARAPENGHLDGLLGLFAGEIPSEHPLPGETARLADLYYRFFEDASGEELLEALQEEYGDLSLAVDRRSAEGFLVWALLAFAASGRQFWAFRYARRCRQGGGLSRVPHFFHEEPLRWATAAERYGLFRRWERSGEMTADESHQWARSAEAQLSCGADQALRMEEVLGIPAQSPGFTLPPDVPESFLRSCHERFEELLLDPPDWLFEGRRWLAAFAGWDLRARALLSLLYGEDPDEALRHLCADRRTPVVMYRQALILEDTAEPMEGKKRQRNLRKMLEGSLTGQDPGPQTIGKS